MITKEKRIWRIFSLLYVSYDVWKKKDNSWMDGRAL